MDNPVSSIRLLVQMSSGEPWNLSLSVQEAGEDLLVRLHGGCAHIGAVALAHWTGTKPEVEGRITVPGHAEGALATVAAHRLCKAARNTVTCICGIHFDDLTKQQVHEIETVANDLIARAGAELNDRRIAHDLCLPECPIHEIESRARELEPEVRSLLSIPSKELAARVRTAMGDDRPAVQLFAPLYLSNACPNDCAYCGFRHSAEFERKNLNLEQALREARVLAESGFRMIDLVTGEIPTDAFIESVCRALEMIRTRTPIDQINLNLGALFLEQFQRLVASGAKGYHLYQETYDPDTYREVHRSGHKRDMPARLRASLDAADAGFERMGLGVLLGLREPVFDLARMIAHGQLLRDRRAGSGTGLKIGYSLPRIVAVDPGCEYRVSHPVDDETFMRCVLALRLMEPQAGLTLTSREPEWIKEILLPLGVNKVSAGVSTRPGGYAEASDQDRAQFEISDERSLDEMSALISSLGLTPAL